MYVREDNKTLGTPLLLSFDAIVKIYFSMYKHGEQHTYSSCGLTIVSFVQSCENLHQSWNGGSCIKNSFVHVMRFRHALLTNLDERRYIEIGTI